MPKIKKSDLQKEDVALRGIQYAHTKETIKALESECKGHRPILEAFVDNFGRELESGSKLAVISHADIDIHLKKTLRVGKQLLPEAIDILRENGLDECIEEIPTIREDILERLYSEGKVSDEMLTKIYQVKNNYAFSVELKERMHDAPE